MGEPGRRAEGGGVGVAEPARQPLADQSGDKQASKGRAPSVPVLCAPPSPDTILRGLLFDPLRESTCVT